MSDLAGFLLARIDEDEQRATRADRERIQSAVYRSQNCYAGDVMFIARHDPARVLARCEADRQLVDLHGESNGACPSCGDWNDADAAGVVEQAAYPCLTLRLLAVPYADHPDYRQEWRPGS